MKRRKDKQPTVDAMLRNVYRSPLEDVLTFHMPDFYQIAEFTISDLRVKQAVGSEREFCAWLSAALYSTVTDMAAELRAPTFPVHDTPMEMSA